MSVHDDLRALRTLLERPEHWKSGYGSDPLGRHCLISGIRVVAPLRRRYEVGDTLVEAVGCRDSAEPWAAVGEFNDSHTHAEVLAVIDKAIAATAPSSHRGATPPAPAPQTDPARLRETSTNASAGQGARVPATSADWPRSRES